MDDTTFKALQQIKQTGATITVKKVDVDYLINEGWADETDGDLFLTEAGGKALEDERDRRSCAPKLTDLDPSDNLEVSPMYRPPFTRTCVPFSPGISPGNRGGKTFHDVFQTAEAAQVATRPEGTYVQSIVDADGVQVFPAPTA
jgi:hypothetical protein